MSTIKIFATQDSQQTNMTDYIDPHVTNIDQES